MKQHRRKSIRLPGYDYSQAGWYFVTICTGDRECRFGYVVDGHIRCTALGRLVKGCWRQIPKHFKNVSLDVFAIMPNHIHGIIVIHDFPVGTRHALSLQRRYQTLPSVIGSFKSSVSRKMRSLSFDGFRWQRSYNDHVIRHEASFRKIRHYIVNNARKWDLDRDNPTNFRRYGS